MNAIDNVRQRLAERPLRWLVTGSAGFIGSHLVQALLDLDQSVVGLDNFATGHRHNLDEVRDAVTEERWSRHRFLEADVCDAGACRQACLGTDVVLHQAALGSVPRSLADPIATNASNVDGFLNMLVAARDSGVRRFVYAASSSTYGDHPALPKVEDAIGHPLSPYAVTKLVNELYADVFARCYDMQSIGLRYFNIFGARQDPEGAYAAVIPRWIRAMLQGEEVVINGDGETSRDFCYVDNAVQANLLAAAVEDPAAVNQVYNIAVDDRTSLNRLFLLLRDAITERAPAIAVKNPFHGDFRPGDVRHSQADIGKARALLGYAPTHRLQEGIRRGDPVVPRASRRCFEIGAAAFRRARMNCAYAPLCGVRHSLRVASAAILFTLLCVTAQRARADPDDEFAQRLAALRTEARAYEHGEGVTRDTARALELYCEASRLGDAEAQFGLGWMYANGRGVPRDNRMASLFFGMAAAQGHGYAQKMLAFVGPSVADLPDCMRDPVPDTGRIGARRC